MSVKRLSEVQSIGDLVGSKKKEAMKKQFVDTLRSFMERKGYRADLVVVSNQKTSERNVSVEIKYNTEFDFPADKDLMALIATTYPDYEVDWATAVVDDEAGTIAINLRPTREIIPIKGYKDIPSDFEPQGTGIFHRKADATGNVAEVWELRKGADGGLALVRKMDDMQVLKGEEDSIKVNDAVRTPEGVGRVESFDEVGNAYVRIGNQKRLMAAEDLAKYDTNKDKQTLFEYFKQVYGDEFAKALCMEEFGDVEDNRK